MVTPGRRPDPTHLRLVEAVAPAAAGGTAAGATPARVVAPRWLGQAARAEFARAAAELARLQKWSPLFVTTLAAYADAYARWREAERRIGPAGGRMLTSPNGYLYESPWTAEARKQRAAMIGFAALMGLTLVHYVKVQDTQLSLDFVAGDAAPAGDILADL